MRQHFWNGFADEIEKLSAVGGRAALALLAGAGAASVIGKKTGGELPHWYTDPIADVAKRAVSGQPREPGPATPAMEMRPHTLPPGLDRGRPPSARPLGDRIDQGAALASKAMKLPAAGAGD